MVDRNSPSHETPYQDTLDILEYEFTVSGVSLSGASWGEWSGECPLGTAVAGIQTIYEPYQGEFSDDTAVGGIKMFCGGF